MIMSLGFLYPECIWTYLVKSGGFWCLSICISWNWHCTFCLLNLCMWEIDILDSLLVQFEYTTYSCEALIWVQGAICMYWQPYVTCKIPHVVRKLHTSQPWPDLYTVNQFKSECLQLFKKSFGLWRFQIANLGKCFRYSTVLQVVEKTEYPHHTFCSHHGGECHCSI